MVDVCAKNLCKVKAKAPVLAGISDKASAYNINARYASPQIRTQIPHASYIAPSRSLSVIGTYVESLRNHPQDRLNVFSNRWEVDNVVVREGRTVLISHLIVISHPLYCT